MCAVLGDSIATAIGDRTVGLREVARAVTA
jgi:hypothetical protein